MSDREPRLETLIEDIVEDRLADVHTCLPAEVTAFDAARNTVSVQPLIKVSLIDDDGDTQEETLPQIEDVPILYPRGAGGKFSMTWPLGSGDIVTLVFAERSLDRWVSGDGAEANPGDLRKHQLSDAIAIPGGYPFKRAEDEPAVEPDRVTIRYGSDTVVEVLDGEVQIIVGGTEVKVTDGLIELGEDGAGEKASIDSKIQDNLSDISTQLDTLKTDFNTHTHPLADFLAPLIPLPGPTVPTFPIGLVPGAPNMKPDMPSTAAYSPTATESTLVTIKE